MTFSTFATTRSASVAGFSNPSLLSPVFQTAERPCSCRRLVRVATFRAPLLFLGMCNANRHRRSKMDYTNSYAPAKELVGPGLTNSEHLAISDRQSIDYTAVLLKVSRAVTSTIELSALLELVVEQ